jgi:hypothetical protein
MSLVCYLSPLYLFTDAHLLPKWYLCLVGLAVTGVFATMVLLRGKRLYPFKISLLFISNKLGCPENF